MQSLRVLELDFSNAKLISEGEVKYLLAQFGEHFFTRGPSAAPPSAARSGAAVGPGGSEPVHGIKMRRSSFVAAAPPEPAQAERAHDKPGPSEAFAAAEVHGRMKCVTK